MKYITTLTLLGSIVAAQSINLDTVVVSATKSEQKIKDVTSNVTVITKEELEDKHITTVAEALRATKGIIIARTGGLGQPTSFYLRGFNSGSTLVLVNGVNINNPITGQANIDDLMVSDIERIEIVKGAQSGIYGANATAGVINIITKTSNNGNIGNINLEYGKYNTKKMQSSISKKIGNLSFYLGYNYLKSDGFSAQADIKKDLDSFEDDSYKNKTYNINLSYDFTKNDKLSLKYTNINSDVDYDGGLAFQKGYYAKHKDKILNLSFLHKYSQDSYSKIYYSYSKFKDAWYSPLFPAYKINATNKEFGIDNKIKLNNIDILFGADKKVSKDTNKKIELKSKGIYITANTKINNSIFTATIRKDFYSNFKDKATGKIGFKHIFDNGLTISSNYGTAYNTPNLYQYSLNKNLKPESIKSFDIGFEYKNFSLTYFNNSIKDEIFYPAFNKVANRDKKSKIKGFEVGYKGAISDDLIFALNYTRFNAKDEDGKQLLRRPKYIINGSVDYYGFKNTHINLTAQYVGKRDNLDWSTFPARKVKMKSYFRANLAIDYKINDNVKAYVKIDNITDKKYQEVYGYATSGRAFYVGINAKF